MQTCFWQPYWRCCFINIILQSRSSLTSLYSSIVLAFTWGSGLFLGIILYFNSLVDFTSLMRGASFSSVSIVWVPFCTAALYLLCAISAVFSLPCLIYAVSIFKGICFAFLSLLLICSFPNGWLIRSLFMFFEILNLPILYSFWHRCLNCKCISTGEFMGWFSIIMLIFALDFHFVSPILSGFFIL